MGVGLRISSTIPKARDTDITETKEEAPRKDA